MLPPPGLTNRAAPCTAVRSPVPFCDVVLPACLSLHPVPMSRSSYLQYCNTHIRRRHQLAHGQVVKHHAPPRQPVLAPPSLQALPGRHAPPSRPAPKQHSAHQRRPAAQTAAPAGRPQRRAHHPRGLPLPLPLPQQAAPAAPLPPMPGATGRCSAAYKNAPGRGAGRLRESHWAWVALGPPRCRRLEGRGGGQPSTPQRSYAPLPSEHVSPLPTCTAAAASSTSKNSAAGWPSAACTAPSSTACAAICATGAPRSSTSASTSPKGALGSTNWPICGAGVDRSCGWVPAPNQQPPCTACKGRLGSWSSSVIGGAGPSY